MLKNFLAGAWATLPIFTLVLLLLPIFILVVLLFGVVMDEYLSLPRVYTSYTTGECVGIVLDNNTRLSCDRLPEFNRYENIWVQ